MRTQRILIAWISSWFLYDLGRAVAQPVSWTLSLRPRQKKAITKLRPEVLQNQRLQMLLQERYDELAPARIFGLVSENSSEVDLLLKVLLQRPRKYDRISSQAFGEIVRWKAQKDSQLIFLVTGSHLTHVTQIVDLKAMWLLNPGSIVIYGAAPSVFDADRNTGLRSESIFGNELILAPMGSFFDRTKLGIETGLHRNLSLSEQQALLELLPCEGGVLRRPREVVPPGSAGDSK